MKIIEYPMKEQWTALLRRPAFDIASLESTVAAILSDVKKNGNTAVAKYTLKFDQAKVENLQVSEAEFEEAEKEVSQELKEAIKIAISTITAFHISQKEEVKVIETMAGVSCWRKSVAIEKVGLYIPGGSAPLFSTVLMLGVPAVIAGCKEIVLCTPPDKTGKINPAILVAAKVAGIKTIFKIGGAQAIGAMTYGTETVPAVYKIFGPGNQYVTCAKQLVSRSGVATDMPAGPSELAMLVDETCILTFVAADLLSQAEHGADSQVILVSDNKEVIETVLGELDLQVEQLPRKEIAKKALENSKAILVKDKSEAMELLNEYAPEHLIIATSDNESLADKVINAGSVFLGNYSCESAGDYASGTNHTLPTNGNAKVYSGVSLDSFLKKITFQKLTKQGLQTIGSSIEIMAEAEGLAAHKNAVSIRLN